MKYNYLYFLLFNLFSIFSFSQEIRPEDRYKKYFLLEDLSKLYKKTEYTLNSKELYGIDKNIKVYNFFTNYNAIILISALPSLKNNNDWIKISYKIIKNKILTKNEINDFEISRSLSNPPEMKTMEFGIIKKIGDEYFIPNECLIEFFNYGDYEYPFITRYGTINTKEQLFTIKDMIKFYESKYPQKQFPLDVRNKYGAFVENVVVKNYLSKKYKIKNDDAYQLWTFDSWKVYDGYNIQRGIDRFIYIPQKGIVGGSYDFYFTFVPKKNPPISAEKEWDNILNEKVMIAEELK